MKEMNVVYVVQKANMTRFATGRTGTVAPSRFPSRVLTSAGLALQVVIGERGHCGETLRNQLERLQQRLNRWRAITDAVAIRATLSHPTLSLGKGKSIPSGW